MPLYVGDIGNTLSASLLSKEGGTVAAVDLSTAAVYFLLQKPTGEVIERTATVVNAKRGLAKYVTVANDIDTDGTWQWQARIEFADGSIWHGPQQSFEVHEHLTETA